MTSSNALLKADKQKITEASPKRPATSKCPYVAPVVSAADTPTIVVENQNGKLITVSI
jgi:hypothetical protein